MLSAVAPVGIDLNEVSPAVAIIAASSQDAPAPDPAPTPSTAQAFPLINLPSFRGDPLFAGLTGAGYSAVIIDTGIDLDHPFFGPDANGDGVADRIVYQHDFADNDDNASDFSSHGSHVSSILASSDSTFFGVAPGVNIIALKVYRDTGSSAFSIMERALQWVVANASVYNIVSVNMSSGDNGSHTVAAGRYGMGDELAELAAMNIIVTASAGNDFANHNSEQGVAYPASDPNALAVGAVFDTSFGPSTAYNATATVTGADIIAPFSQRHATLTDIFAPGSPITAANRTGGTITLSGTSQASPMIAGIAVLAQQLAERELGRRLTLAEFTDLIQTTGVSIVDGDDEVDNVINTGLTFKRVDLHALGLAIIDMAGGEVSAPKVTRVAVGAANWDETLGDHLQALGLGDELGLTLSTGTAAQTAVLPWVNLNQIVIQFNVDVDVRRDDLMMVGVNVADYAGVLADGSFFYDSETFTAVWTLSEAIGNDKIRLVLSDRVADLNGNALDGEWVDGQSTTSGDGEAGGDLVMRLNVLPGDVNRSGAVDGVDVNAVRGAQFRGAAAPGYGPFLDVNGSAVILADDAVFARNRQFTSLPAGDPPMSPGSAPLAVQAVVPPAPQLAAVAAPGAVRINLVPAELMASYWMGGEAAHALSRVLSAGSGKTDDWFINPVAAHKAFDGEGGRHFRMRR